ncbi:hypothetical protein TSUD_75530 [Trifolium subterraneum]|nr:hypothetical protein TSUD_75530 [Trifolium subterraneum]
MSMLTLTSFYLELDRSQVPSPIRGVWLKTLMHQSSLVPPYDIVVTLYVIPNHVIEVYVSSIVALTFFNMHRIKEECMSLFNYRTCIAHG